MTDGSSSFLVINDVIMTSVLWLKIVYVLANLSDNLFHKYFSFYGYF